MVRRLLPLLVLAVVALSPSAAGASAAEPNGGRIAVTSLESSLLAEINAVRRTHRLAAVRPSVRLAAAAAAHSRAMAARGFFDHASADGTSFWRRIERLYGRRGFSYWSVGENLLWASPDIDARSAVAEWLASPPHRRTLLDPRWREIGLSGVRAFAAPGVYGGQDVTIVTADFGVRR